MANKRCPPSTVCILPNKNTFTLQLNLLIQIACCSRKPFLFKTVVDLVFFLISFKKSLTMRGFILVRYSNYRIKLLPSLLIVEFLVIHAECLIKSPECNFL